MITLYRGEGLPDIIVRRKKNWPLILYPSQNLSSHGARFARVPLFGSSNVSIIKLELGWIISALLLSSQVLWTLVEETPLFQSKWHGWFLVYLSRQSLNRSSNYNSKGEVFKMCQMNSVERLLNTKLNVDSLSQAIEDIGVVGYINLTGDYLVELQDRSLLNIIHHKLSNEEISTIEALIIEHYYINIDGNIQENITIGEDIELSDNDILLVCSN